MSPSNVNIEEAVESSFTLVDRLHDPLRFPGNDDVDEPAPSALVIEDSAVIENLYEGPRKCRCCVNWVDKIPEEAEPDSDSDDDDGRGTPIVIRYFVTRGETASRVSIHSIEIKDAAARKVLFSVFEGYDNIHPDINCLVLRAPFKPFYYRWARFQTAVDACEDPRTAEILQQLRCVVKSELSKAFTVEKELVANGLISFPYLWTIFRPGGLVCEDSYRGVRFYYVERTEDFAADPEFRIHALGLEYDGYRWGFFRTSFTIDHFDGVKKITDLFVFPERFLEDAEKSKAAAIERGRKYQSLTDTRYMEYPDDNGLPLWLPHAMDKSGGEEEEEKKKTKGKTKDDKDEGKQQERTYNRVMIDFGSTHLRKPRLAIFREEKDMTCETGAIAQVPVDTPVGGHKPLVRNRRADSRSPERNDYSDYDANNAAYERRRVRRPRRQSRSVSPDARSPRRDRYFEEEHITDFHLLICDTRLPGFCLKRRRWQYFQVDLVRDIQWSADPFNTLVLPDGYKDLILSFVESHIGGEKSFDDVIGGKACTILTLYVLDIRQWSRCPTHRAPGVGKTLTAESVAETLRVPLYFLDLGQVIVELDEERLAERWNAILLVDECDLYLEPRSETSPVRNRVVTKFLQEIEYSSSLLFLTTNRPNALDPALASRIHLTVTYPALDEVSRRTIWETFLSHNGCPRLQPAALDVLSRVPLNGRRIRNVVRAASIMAGRNKRSVEFTDIKTVLQIIEGQVVEDPRAGGAA
ncbi:unnamed protein product [Parascedosporium putredinis]|uniref:P-loop containing nucleoside triphosphate hydrolase protein n=1 Tax=Parascedosporium putredinis TaxID=1442378 RepID=A0A9P1H8K4_9PEZI|nr:unnamed protein product [Parascedosporium putredinis]CAI8002474.1 unnamed protein product [Parascedosporium putredinis]